MEVNKEIEEMTQDFIKLQITTRQGVETFAKQLYNMGYRKIDDYEKLKAENERLLNCVEKNFTFETTGGNKYSVFNTVRKEFAEKLKRVLHYDYITSSGQTDERLVFECVDNLLKEYENDN